MGMGNISGSVAAGGTLGGGEPSGYFIGPLPRTPSFSSDRLAALSGMSIALATSGGLPPVPLPGGTTAKLPLAAGLSFLYSGPSPFPELCDGDVSLAIALVSPAAMDLSAACDLDLRMDMPGTRSINFMALKHVLIGAAISPTTTEFKVGATVQLATSSPIADSACQDPYTDAACLTVDATFTMGFYAPQPSVILTVHAARARHRPPDP